MLRISNVDYRFPYEQLDDTSDLSYEILDRIGINGYFDDLLNAIVEASDGSLSLGDAQNLLEQEA